MLEEWVRQLITETRTHSKWYFARTDLRSIKLFFLTTLHLDQGLLMFMTYVKQHLCSCVYMFMCVCTCVGLCGQRWTSGVFLNSSLHCTWDRTSSGVSPRCFGATAGHQHPGRSGLQLPGAATIVQVLGSELVTSQLHTNWAMSSVLKRYFLVFHGEN